MNVCIMKNPNKYYYRHSDVEKFLKLIYDDMCRTNQDETVFAKSTGTWYFKMLPVPTKPKLFHVYHAVSKYNMKRYIDYLLSLETRFVNAELLYLTILSKGEETFYGN